MNFRFMGFPVRVEISFFIVAAFIGMSPDGRRWAIWIVTVFVSVLIHELGHAIVGRRFGLSPQIQLYAMGGLTSWGGAGRRLTHLQSIMVSLAGPGAGFAAGLLVLALSQSLPRDSFILDVAIANLLWVNFGWGIINLLPILPLDGGSVVRSAVHMFKGYPDEVTPLRVSVVAGVAAAVLAIMNGLLLAGLLAGWITFQNFTALQRVGRSRF